MTFTLFGYPKTGKTSLFNILTGSRETVSAFEAGRREAHERVAAVPDPRLDRISALYPERARVPATVDFLDLAGISYGEVKTSVFLNALRRADVLVHVARGFHDEQVPAPKDRVDPAADIRAMAEELVLADLIAIEARLEKLDKDLKKAKLPEGERERDLLARLRGHCDSGRTLCGFPFTEAEEKAVRAFAFLSQKPILHLVNVDETDAGRLEAIEREIAPAAAAPGAAVLAFCGRIEREILEVEDEAEKRSFLAEFGLPRLTADAFYPLAFRLLKTIFFYTIGKDEVRAWPLAEGSPALRAAGTIHTDIEKGFIRAEVAAPEDLLAAGGWAEAREKGAVRLEGKDYVVRDGDVVYFRFAT